MINPYTLLDIENERVRQHSKWGEQNRCPTAWIAICVEELGEATQHALTLDLTPNHPHVLEARVGYRQEMVELAACAIAAIETLDRNKWAPGDLYSHNAGKPEN